MLANVNAVSAYANDGTSIVKEQLGENAESALNTVAFAAGLFSKGINYNDFAKKLANNGDVTAEAAKHLWNTFSTVVNSTQLK